MKRLVTAVALVALAACSSPPPAPAESPEMAAWRQRAEGVTNTRDDWGIPHISA